LDKDRLPVPVMLVRTVRYVEFELAIIRSDLPSLLRSATVTATGCAPVAMTVGVAKDGMEFPNRVLLSSTAT